MDQESVSQSETIDIFEMLPNGMPIEGMTVLEMLAAGMGKADIVEALGVVADTYPDDGLRRVQDIIDRSKTDQQFVGFDPDFDYTDYVKIDVSNSALAADLREVMRQFGAASGGEGQQMFRQIGALAKLYARDMLEQSKWFLETNPGTVPPFVRNEIVGLPGITSDMSSSEILDYLKTSEGETAYIEHNSRLEISDGPYNSFQTFPFAFSVTINRDEIEKTEFLTSEGNYLDSSLQRVLFHELAGHAANPFNFIYGSAAPNEREDVFLNNRDVQNLLRNTGKPGSHQEADAICRTNHFMEKYYGESDRVGHKTRTGEMRTEPAGDSGVNESVQPNLGPDHVYRNF